MKVSAPENPESGGPLLWVFSLLIISQILFGSNQIMARLIDGAVPPIGLSFWRWIIATLVVLPFTVKYIRQFGPLIIKEWRIYVGSAFCLIVLGNTTIYIALNYTTAINGAIVSSVQPVFTFALSWLLYRELVSKGQIVGAFISIFGVLFIITRGEISSLAELQPNPGDLWMIVSVTGFSLYAVLLRKLPSGVPAILTLNTIQFLGIILLLPFYFWETNFNRPMELNQVTIMAVLWAGIIVAVAALGLWNYTNRKMGANKASGTVHLRLVAITVMAIFILDESLEIFHFVAFAIIMLGVYAITKSKPKVTHAEEK
jgi:drug/metabolite transporter (DMT)-like permease